MMKKIINYLLSFLCLTFFLGCSIENENNADFIESITDPLNISADVSIDEATGWLQSILLAKVWYYLT